MSNQPGQSDSADQSGDVVFIGYIDAEDRISFDPFNANLGTEEGDALLEASLEKYGAGRSIVLDRNNVDIAGNKTLEKWLQKGGKVAVVETDGRTLIAVRRRDLDLATDDAARELAFADNATAEKNLNWNLQRIVDEWRRGLDLSASFTNLELEDFARLVDLPSVDDQANALAEPDAAEFREPLRLLLDREVIDLYHDLVRGVEGDDNEKFSALLHWAERGISLSAAGEEDEPPAR